MRYYRYTTHNSPVGNSELGDCAENSATCLHSSSQETSSAYQAAVVKFCSHQSHLGRLTDSIRFAGNRAPPKIPKPFADSRFASLPPFVRLVQPPHEYTRQRLAALPSYTRTASQSTFPFAARSSLSHLALFSTSSHPKAEQACASLSVTSQQVRTLPSCSIDQRCSSPRCASSLPDRFRAVRRRLSRTTR